MTMYVRVVGAPMTLTISSQDHEDDVLLDGTSPYAVLPLWAAQKPEFQALWADERVEVATNTAFTQIITEIPASELGTGAIPTTAYIEEIVDGEGHTVLRLVDGTVAPGIASNYLIVTNGTVGNAPSIAVGGTVDNDVSLVLSSKGNAGVKIGTGGGIVLEAWGPVSEAVNHFVMISGQAGDPVVLAVTGEQADTDILIYAAGEGRVFVNDAPVSNGIKTINALTPSNGVVTLGRSHTNTLVTINEDFPVTVVVPPNSTEWMRVGTTIEVARLGDGHVTVVGDTDVVVYGKDGTALAEQNSSAILRQIEPNVWLLTGDTREAIPSPVTFTNGFATPRDLAVDGPLQAFTYLADTAGWEPGQSVAFYDNTPGSNLVYYGPLSLQFAGGFGTAVGLNTVTTITGTTANDTSASWTLSAMVPEPVTLNLAPATATSPGNPGQIAATADYVYVCVATNTWRRAGLSSW